MKQTIIKIMKKKLPTWKPIKMGDSLPCQSFLRKKSGEILKLSTGAGIKVGQDAYYLPVDDVIEEIKNYPIEESENEKTKRLLHTIAYKIGQHLRDVFTEEEYQCYDAWSNAWLESKGEQKHQYNSRPRYIGEEELLGKQNHTDKVEPKFKVGDWVVYECSGETATLQIARIVGETYVFSDDSTLDVVDEDTLRLWDITKDAKDGDVLCTKNKCCPFIYDKGRYNNGLAYYYAGIDVCGNLNIKSPHNMLAHFGKLDNICPATQEQRDLLFKKMKEAGYEWDAELKQLKKIEQKPVKVPKFKVGDFIQFNGMGHTRYTIKEVCGLSHYINTCNKRMDMSYTDANFELVEQKPNGWSEEDERIKNNLLSELTNLSVRKLIEKDTEKKYANWLKSLRPQSQWRPSDAQMVVLNDIIINGHLSNTNERILKGLQEQLKKLKD